MQQKKLKRLTTLALCVVMLTSSTGMTVFAAANLSDVNGHWAHEAIEKLVDSNIVSGYNDNTFKPDGNITRAEFVTIINKFFGFTDDSVEQFADVNANAWYAQQLRIAKKAGYFSGTGNNMANPESNITRQDAFAIIARIYGIKSSGTVTFADSDQIADYAKDAIAALIEAGIISGYNDNTIKPTNLLTRAETASFIVKSEPLKSSWSGSAAQQTIAPTEPTTTEKPEETQKTTSGTWTDSSDDSSSGSGGDPISTAGTAVLSGLEINDITEIEGTKTKSIGGVTSSIKDNYQINIFDETKFSSSKKSYNVTVQSDIYGVIIKPEAGRNSKITSITADATTRNYKEEVTYNASDKIEYSERYDGYIVYLDQSYAGYNSEFVQNVSINVENKNGSKGAYTVKITRECDKPLFDKFEQKTYEYETDNDTFLLDYNIYYPKGYEASNKKYPVVLALHGAGQKAGSGTDDQQVDMILKRYQLASIWAKDSETDVSKECIVIAPQVNVDRNGRTGWGGFDTGEKDEKGNPIRDTSRLSVSGEAAHALLKEVIAEGKSDENRIYVTGASMGGQGTWAMLNTHPETFAAAIPCCGLTDVDKYNWEQLKENFNGKIYFMHSEDDSSSVGGVNFTEYGKIKAKLDEYGIDYYTNIYPADTIFYPTPHFSWTPAYADVEIRNWLFEQRKGSLQEGTVLSALEIIDSVDDKNNIVFDGKKDSYNLTVQSDIYGVLVKPTAARDAEILKVYTANTPAAYGGTDSNEELEITLNDKYGGYVIPLSQTYEAYKDQNDSESGISTRQTTYIVVKTASGEEKTITINIKRESDDKIISKFERKMYTYETTDEKYLNKAVEVGQFTSKPEKLTVELPYYVYMPNDIEDGEKLPIVFALHGAGQRPPQDAEMILRRYRFALEFAEYSEEGKQRCIVIAPQCNTPLTDDGKPLYDWGLPDQIEEGKLMPSVYLEAAYQMLQDFKTENSDIVDTNRIYCTGMSMGGMGTFAMGLAYPDEWAALMPVVGFKVGANDNLDGFSNIPMRLGVSVADTTYAEYIGRDGAINIQDKLNIANVNWDSVIYDENTFLWTTPHFAWIPFYADERNFEWMFEQEREEISVNGTIVEDDVNGTTNYLYVSEDWERDQNSAQPFIMIYGDKPFTEESVKKYIADNGLDDILPEYHANVEFVNPINGENWTEADVENYVTVAANIHHQRANDDYKLDGVYAGFYGRFYVVADGSGADFVNTKLMEAFDNGDLNTSRAVGNGNCLPTSVMLFNAKQTPVSQNIETLPAMLYSCSDSVVNYYENLNDERINPCYITETANGSISDADVFKEGYKTISSMYRFYVNDKDNGSAEYRYYQIPDWQAEGIKVDSLGASYTAGGYDLDVYAFMDEDIDMNDPHGLVVGLHGGGNSVTFFAWSTQWPERAKANDLIYVGIQNHDKLSGTEETVEKINGIIDEIIDTYNIDETKIYLTGFSQGSANTLTAAFGNAERFAGIMPLDGVSNVSADGLEGMYLPTYYVAGDKDVTPTRPEQGTGNVEPGLNAVLAINGIEHTIGETDGIWKLNFDSSNTIDDIADGSTGSTNTIVQNFYAVENSDGEEINIVCFQLIDMIHCTIKTNSDYAWDFIKHFTRNEDGIISHDGVVVNSENGVSPNSIDEETEEETENKADDTINDFDNNKNTEEVIDNNSGIIDDTVDNNDNSDNIENDESDEVIDNTEDTENTNEITDSIETNENIDDKAENFDSVE